MEEPIVALASAEGGAPLALLRVSGEHCWRAVADLLASRAELHHGVPMRCRLRWREGALPLPALLLPFERGRSYTGEESAELLLPASPPAIRELLDLLHQRGVRSARPGEFTRRAFLHGKIDLTRAESVAELIAAEDLHTARRIRPILDGALAGSIRALGDRIHDALALLEAGLDFSEQEIESPSAEELARLVEKLAAECNQLLAAPAARVRERARVRFLLWGKTNAGKSTLFNRLIGEERAITSASAGTTRDPISCALSWEGIPSFELVDLAGIKEIENPLEQAADTLSQRLLSEDDAVIYLMDGTASPGDIEQEWNGVRARLSQRLLPVLSKIDLVPALRAGALPQAMRCSSHTGAGLAELKEWIVGVVRGEDWQSSGDGLLFTARQRAGVASCAAVLEEALRAIKGGEMSTELLVAELMRARGHLEEITGELVTEETLDRIFLRFCLGK